MIASSSIQIRNEWAYALSTPLRHQLVWALIHMDCLAYV
jgi:hypothetical protein